MVRSRHTLADNAAYYRDHPQVATRIRRVAPLTNLGKQRQSHFHTPPDDVQRSTGLGGRAFFARDRILCSPSIVLWIGANRGPISGANTCRI